MRLVIFDTWRLKKKHVSSKLETFWSTDLFWTTLKHLSCSHRPDYTLFTANHTALHKIYIKHKLNRSLRHTVRESVKNESVKNNTAKACAIHLQGYSRARNRKEVECWAWTEPSPFNQQGCSFYSHILRLLYFASMESCKLLSLALCWSVHYFVLDFYWLSSWRHCEIVIPNFSQCQNFIATDIPEPVSQCNGGLLSKSQ